MQFKSNRRGERRASTSRPRSAQRGMEVIDPSAIPIGPIRKICRGRAPPASSAMRPPLSRPTGSTWLGYGGCIPPPFATIRSESFHTGSEGSGASHMCIFRTLIILVFLQPNFFHCLFIFPQEIVHSGKSLPIEIRISNDPELHGRVCHRSESGPRLLRSSGWAHESPGARNTGPSFPRTDSPRINSSNPCN